MKSDYEKKVYEFYTKAENFETMLHVADQVQWVTKQVITDFWTETAEHLKVAMKKRDDNWVVEFSNNGDWNAMWIKLWVYRPEWCLTEEYPLLSIAVECLQPGCYPYLGIHIGNDSPLIKGASLKEDINKIEELKSYKTDNNNYWAVKKHIGVHHLGYEDMSKMLPENRKVSIDNVIGEFLELIDLTQNFIPGMIDSNKTK